MQSETFVPDLWPKIIALMFWELANLGVEGVEADMIALDFARRCIGIPPILPAELVSDEIFTGFGALMVDAIAAELRLAVALCDPEPGEEAPPRLPCSTVSATHPFLMALAQVVSEIEAEANAAEGNRRMN